MCQAIVKPHSVSIPKSMLKSAWQSNPDGAGFAVRHADGSVTIHKAYWTFRTFWKAYRDYAHLDCLIHFRYATHGSLSVENVHPFRLGDAALIHNGILQEFTPELRDTRSDTRLFIDTCLTPTLADWNLSARELLGHPEFKEKVEKLIGGWNKLAALSPDGFHIFNEGKGTWSKEGVWYSAGIPNVHTYRYKGYTGYSGYSGYSDYSDDREWQAYWERMSADDLDVRDIPPPHCTVCAAVQTRLTQVGTEELCDRCWDEYAMPCHMTED